jgi:hypothetical protein
VSPVVAGPSIRARLLQSPAAAVAQASTSPDLPVLRTQPRRCTPGDWLADGRHDSQWQHQRYDVPANRTLPGSSPGQTASTTIGGLLMLPRSGIPVQVGSCVGSTATAECRSASPRHVAARPQLRLAPVPRHQRFGDRLRPFVARSVGMGNTGRQRKEPS